jgi:hypothetical protein
MAKGMKHSRPSFWEYTKKSARDATREYFRPLTYLAERNRAEDSSSLHSQEGQEAQRGMAGSHVPQRYETQGYEITSYGVQGYGIDDSHVSPAYTVGDRTL